MIEILFVLSLALILYIYPAPLRSVLELFENIAYDFQIKKAYLPLSKESPIVIVDIDDESIKEQGRWPWSRKIVAELTEKLYAKGASVVVFDVSFVVPEENIADIFAKEMRKSPGTSVAIQEIEGIQSRFDFDALFAKSLTLGDSILGFFFLESGISKGVLPPPLLTLSSELENELFIPEMKSYVGNIEILQKAAKHGAFINGSPDLDGIHRSAPLIIRQGNQIYPSLGLEAARRYLLTKQVDLVLAKYGGTNVLEGIQLDKMVVHTDPYGRILIPFRGPPFSVPYISAADVIHDREEAKSLQNKLVFIGSSSTAIGDIVATSIAPVFTGVEVHANIASGIIDGYLPYRPVWGKGVSVYLVLIVGFLSILMFPLLGPIGSTICAILFPAVLIYSNHWIWIHHRIILSISFPIFTVVVLYLVNLVVSLILEEKRKREILSIFGQYIPKERIQYLVKNGGDLGLEGESKELTVLFADIQQFTRLSEGMSAQAIKQLLNLYLTPMTKIIFDHKGTIDKYVGDLIMAFWGAPINNPENAKDAVDTGLFMQNQLNSLNRELKTLQKPEIRIGIGINTGIMNVGDMGSKYRRAYTVLGDAVNLASRLEAICRFYKVDMIVGENTYIQTQKHFGYRKLDRIKVKGREQSVVIYEPLCQMEKCSTELIADLELHHHAIEAYFAQNWEEAAAFFRKLLSTQPKSQALYQIYLNRIEKFQHSPPGPEWDGVYVFEEK